MDAKEAIKAAKSYVSDIFVDEGLMNLGLEEVKFGELENCWEITLGFSRPWNANRSSLASLTGAQTLQRTYKVVVIKDSSGEVIEIRNREVEEAK
jgi:hypothetical protein